MKGLGARALGGLYKRMRGHGGDSRRAEFRREEIRATMLDMLGDEGAQRYPEVLRRIRAAADAQALWYARPDLMAALAGLYDEKVARTRMVSLSVLFDGTLPKGMMSRLTTLRS